MREGRVARTATWAVVGAVCGVAWAASFRAYMAEISGALSSVAWVGTFAALLLPGLVIGVALGASVPADGARDRRALRWAAASPVVFAVVPLMLPGALEDFLSQGLGGGAVAVGLGAIAGGYALGGGRRIWARVASGLLAAALVVAIAATVPAMGGNPLALTTARGAWVTTLATTLLLVLFLAASIPFRRLASARREHGTHDAGRRDR